MIRRKRNGFTLIELLAVIVILAIIMVIATTRVSKVIDKAKDDSNEINKKNIAKAAEVCLVQEGDESRCNTIDKLMDSEYLEDFKDPYTKDGEYVSQNYPITFNSDGKATVSYYGEGYIKEISKEIKEKEYFTWNGSTVTGLTTEGFNWVKNNDWTLVIPTNATSIGDLAFEKSKFCTIKNSKKTVIIPGNVKTIGSNSFWNCGITSLYLNSGTNNIKFFAFRNNNISYLQIPSSSIEIGQGAFSLNKLPDDQAFIYKRTSKGIDYKTIVAYGGLKKKDIVMPSNVEIINGYTFFQGGIESITLSPNLKSIGSYAFRHNLLTSIAIPKSVASIGQGAFMDNKLTDLDVSHVATLGPGYVTGNNFPIDKAIIYDQKDPAKINSYASKNRGGEVIVPEGIKTIGPAAFGYTELSSVILPNSLEKIETNAFMDMYYLQSITIPKNVNVIGSYVFTGCSKLQGMKISNQNPNKEKFKATFEKEGIKSDIITFVD